MTGTIRRRCLRAAAAAAATAAAVLAASATAPRAQTGPGADETAGWLRSGRRIALSGLSRKGMPPPAGRFEVLTTTSAAGALLASRDTLWIGTEGGLFFHVSGSDTIIRADGPVFTAVTSVARGDDGDLWVGGRGGVSVRRSGSWEHWTRRSHPFFSDVTDIRPGEGKIWVSTWGSGCGYIGNDSLTVLTRADSLLDDRVTCVLEESGHTIWIGTESGVCRADSFSWRSLRYGSRIPVGRVRDLALDEEGGLFIAVARQGAARYSFGRVAVFGPVQGLPSTEIMRFGTDSAGRIMAAGKGGVSVWDGSGWTPAPMPPEVPPAMEILCVAHDIDGNTFFGTADGRCIIQSRDGAASIDLPRRFPEATVAAVCAREGALWFSGVAGVYRLGETIERFPLPGEWYAGSVSGIVPEAGGIWLSTRFGILHHRNGSWEVFDRRQGLPTENFTAAAAGAGSDIWFATFDRGVLRLGAEGWVHYTKRHGLPGEDIAALRVDQSGAPWIATRSGRIARFDGEVWEVFSLPVTPTRRSPAVPDSTAADQAIRYLDGPGGAAGRSGAAVLGTDASGRILIATGYELFFQSAGEWRVVDLPFADPADGVTCCAGTADGSLWVGTRDDGVYVLGGERWLHADDSSGLGDRSVTGIAVDRDGTVWIATGGGGLTRFTAASR